MTKYMTAGKCYDKMLRMEKSNEFIYPACHAPVINNQLLHVDSRNMDLTGGQTAKYGTFDEISLVRGRPGWCGFGAEFAEVVQIWSGAVRI